MAQARVGKTVKVSVSLEKTELAALKRRAREAHGGNLSAAFAEAAKLVTKREAMRRLIDEMGGPSLTPESAAAIASEQAGGPRYVPKKPKRTRIKAA